MLSSKIQAMMHRDVDGHGIDDHHQRRQSQSTRQLGTYPDAYGGQQADSSQLLQQRRRALAQATSFSEQQDQQRPSAARRAASTGTVNSSAAEAKLLAALRRQTLQDSDENPDGPTSSSSAASTRIPTGTAPPSSDSAANGASDGRALKIRPQIRPWKQTKGKPQDSEKLLALLENRYKGGGVNLGLIGRPSARAVLGGPTGTGDVSSDREGEDQPQASKKGSQSSDSESSTHAGGKEKSMGRIEASIRRKGKALSKLSHRFKDIVTDRLHLQGRKETHSDQSTTVGSSPDTPDNTATTSQANSHGVAGGSFASSKESHSPSHSRGSDPLDATSDPLLSPLASLREREELREREHAKDSSSTPWKPRGSVMTMMSPAHARGGDKARASEDSGKEEKFLDAEGHLLPPEDLMKLQINGTAIEMFKQPLASPAGGSLMKSSPATSIADSLAAAAAAAVLESDGGGGSSLRSGFASPGPSHRPSVLMNGTPSSASRLDRPDGVPLFLRKQSDVHRDRSASNASSALASPSAYGSEASTKWAQELAGLRQHVSQHSSDIEVQISDIETALSNADIGTIKARLELLEDLQRNKKSDVEARLMRMEAELQNMKQVQRSNLKTIYDALSAQSLNTPARRSEVGLGATFMNWIYVLITWFGLGLGTMSQPLGAIYPYVAPLACCRRIFRKADAIASNASGGSPNGSSAAALDAYATNQALAQPSTTSGSGNISSFLPAGAIPHHHSDRDRERHSLVSRSKMDRLSLPLGTSISVNQQSRHRRLQTHSRQASTTTGGEEEEGTNNGPPPMRPASAAPSFSEDENEQSEHTVDPPQSTSQTQLDDADGERELQASAYALSDSDESSLQSDHLHGGHEADSGLAAMHHSRHSTTRTHSRASATSSHATKAPLSTMAQLRNASQRIKEANRRS